MIKFRVYYLRVHNEIRFFLIKYKGVCMKNNLIKLILICSVSFGLLTTMGAAEAHCRWVGGYTSHGHYVPKHKVCGQGYQRCKWVGGHRNRYGHYVPRHKICR